MAIFTPENTLVVMALQKESQGLIESLGFELFYTGVGMIQSAYKTTEIIMKKRPERILNLGTVGSFQQPVGTVGEIHQVVHRGAYFQNMYKPIQLETVTSLPRWICGSADHIEIQSPVDPAFDVMDMELYAVAMICRQQKIPLSSIKVVSDSSGHQVKSEWEKNLQFAINRLHDTLKSI